MKYKIEKNVYLAQPEIKTKQDEKQLLSFLFFRWWMRSNQKNAYFIGVPKQFSDMK
jgi:hypothetical protein